MSDGLLCGNISAASLATVPVPTALTTGLTACENVTYSATANHLLDVLVGGCSGPLGIGEITAEQPDQNHRGRADRVDLQAHGGRHDAHRQRVHRDSGRGAASLSRDLSR